MGTSLVANLTISGGSFNTSSSGGAAIGAGVGHQGRSSVGSVTLSNVHVVLMSRFAAGIGSGSSHAGESSVEILHIVNGSYNVTAFVYGAEIGAGLASIDGESNIGTLLIDSGTFVINASQAAGIGSGPAYVGHSMVANIVITSVFFHITTT
jgi:hypothetical protein